MENREREGEEDEEEEFYEWKTICPKSMDADTLERTALLLLGEEQRWEEGRKEGDDEEEEEEEEEGVEMKGAGLERRSLTDTMVKQRGEERGIERVAEGRRTKAPVESFLQELIAILEALARGRRGE
ncbi:unnamed protein product [Pleuronectes platessa]|uniref:Uncharacterized protein n=1 Tax=Pleuronectes platessa TaxID=8262 RepID=A0A9N7UQR2_PLEPL|nr:unnamed protein product [Pleuronectes platessa]